MGRNMLKKSNLEGTLSHYVNRKPSTEGTLETVAFSTIYLVQEHLWGHFIMFLSSEHVQDISSCVHWNSITEGVSSPPAQSVTSTLSVSVMCKCFHGYQDLIHTNWYLLCYFFLLLNRFVFQRSWDGNSKISNVSCFRWGICRRFMTAPIYWHQCDMLSAALMPQDKHGEYAHPAVKSASGVLVSLCVLNLPETESAYTQNLFSL